MAQDQISALKKLSKDDSIIVCKPDKGNGVVILNKSDYNDKMLHILNDKSKFQSTTNDNNLSNLRKFQGFLFRLKKKKSLSEEDYARIRPTSAATPTLYGLPKIHKQDTPVRPILSCTGSFHHECAIWLTEILTPFRKHQTSVKDTFEFLDRISGLDVDNMLKVYLPIFR